MNSKLFSTILVLLALGFSSKAKEPVTVDFSSSELPEGWSGVKGDWNVVDGVLQGDEKESDQHAAVLMIPYRHTDSEISFRLRTGGVSMFALSYNHPKGHLFRASLSKGQVKLGMDKDKKNPESKPVTLQAEKFEAAPDEWVKVTCKVNGDRAEVSFGDVSLKGSHPDLVKEKTGFRLVVKGRGLAVDDVTYSDVK